MNSLLKAFTFVAVFTAALWKEFVAVAHVSHKFDIQQIEVNNIIVEHVVEPAVHSNLNFILHQQNDPLNKVLDENVVHPAPQILSGITVQTDVLTPLLQSAVLSADGRYCLVTFSTVTDQGGYTYNFPCTKLFSFPGDSVAKCYWIDSSTVKIFPDVTTQTNINNAIQIGSIIMLGITNNIYAVCPVSSVGCVAGMAYPQTQIIEKPTHPTIPNVVVNAPSQISNCASWTVDLTASSGDGGRGWRSIMVNASVYNASSAAKLQSQFRSLVQTSRPFTIDSSAFTIGGTYYVTVTLCNFMFVCGFTTATVSISTVGATPPVAAIAGSVNRVMYTTSPLSLTGSGYVSTCSGTQDSSGLTYSWLIANSSTLTVLGGVSTISKNPNNFLLAPYTLQGIGMYTVQLAVFDTRTKLTGYMDVFVNLLASPLVAAISPSSQQIVKAGRSLVFGAQNSFDPNAVVNGINGMNFKWVCTRVAPTYSASCGFPVQNLTSFNSKVSVTPTAAAVDGTFLLTMIAYKGKRNTTTSVSLKVIPGDAPTLTFLTAQTSLAGLNPANRLLISARVSSNYSCTSIWNTTSKTFKLNQRVLVPTTTTVPAKVDTTVNLYLMENTLLPHSTFTFTLTCDRTQAAIVVTTNGPPVGGVYTAMNIHTKTNSGVELTDIFLFSTSLWSDPELPLTYSFGFVNPSSGLVAIGQSRSEVSFATSTLPGAPSGLSTIVTVFDVVNCSATLNYTLFVNHLPAAQQQQQILQALNASAGSTSIDSIKNLISVASASLSAVNCSLVPSNLCALRNRAPCSATAQTCGSCLSGYVGDAGDANTPCLHASTVNGSSTACSKDSDCPSFYTCSASKCVAVQKSCLHSCSNHGDCQKVDSNTGSIITDCPLSSTTCSAVCKCATGYFGSACQLTSGDIAAQQNLRYLLLSGLNTVVNNEDSTNETVSSAVTSMAALVQSSYDLNNASLPVFQFLSGITLLSAASDPQIDINSVKGLLASVNAAIQAQLGFTSSNPANASSTLNFLTAITSLYDSVVQRQLVVGQDPQTNTLSTFRAASVELALAAEALEVALSVPLTPLEKLTLKVTSSVSGSVTNSSLNAVGMSVAQFSASMVVTEGNQSVLSNVVQVKFGATVNPIIFRLAHIAEVPNAPQENFTSICSGPSDTRVINHTCAGSNYFIQHDCRGRTGPMISMCPPYVPQCNFVNLTGSNTFSSKGICSVLNVTKTHTICQCFTNLTEGGRRLIDSTFDTIAYDAGVYNMMAMSEYTTDELSTTFRAAPDLFSPGAAAKVITVIVMFGVLWLGGLFIIFGSVWKQQKAKAKYAEKQDKLVRAVNANPPTNRNMKVSLERYVRSVFPSVFYQDNWLMKLKEEILKNHIYLILLTAPKGELEDKKRIIAGVKLLTVQTCLMCLLAIFYDIQCPTDDGSCDNLSTQASCLSRTSILDDTQNYCQWTQYAPDIPDGICSFNNPNITFKTALYVQVIVSVLSLFLMKPMDWCFDLLIAPTEKQIQITRAKEHTLERSFYANTIIQTGRRLSNMIMGRGSVTPLQPSQLQQLDAVKRKNRSSSVRQLSDAVQRNHIVAQAILKSQTFKLDPSIKIPQPNEVVEHFDADALLNEIFRQRESLNAEELETFDKLWGIETVSHIGGGFGLGGGNRPATLDIRPEAKEKIRKHIEFVLNDYSKLKEKITDNKLTHSNRGLEILYEFILDLLGRDTPAAKIFRAKAEEDFQQLKVIPTWVKALAIFAVIALNGFFIFYSILRGYIRGQQWQHDYLVACIIQMIAEIFLFQTMECMWINFIVPNLVAKEVHKTNGILNALIDRVCNHIRNDGQDERHTLNTAEFFFVSRKLASLYPQLVESVLVFSYRNYLPGEAARQWIKPEDRHLMADAASNSGDDQHMVNQLQTMQRIEDRHRTWKEVSFVGSMIIALQGIGTLPFFFQKMIVRFVQPFFYGGMVNLFQIIFASTVDTVIFVIALVLAIGLLIYQGVTSARKRRNRVTTPVAGEVMPVQMASPGIELGPIKEDQEGRKPLLPAHAKSISNEDSKDEDTSNDHDANVRAPGKARPHHHHHHRHPHQRGDKKPDLSEDQKADDGNPRAARARATQRGPQRIMVKRDNNAGPAANPAVNSSVEVLRQKKREERQKKEKEGADSSVSTIQLPGLAKAQRHHPHHHHHRAKEDQVRSGQHVSGEDLEGGSSLSAGEMASLNQGSSVISGDVDGAKE